MALSLNRPSLKWAALGAAFLVVSSFLIPAGPAGLPPFHRPVMEPYALTDMGFALLGLRRWGADAAFIQWLQYYASDYKGEKAGPEAHADGDGHIHMGAESTADLHPEVRLDFYPRFLDHGRRTVSLDPYFHYAYIFGAVALAFNLNRADEALALLNEGVRRDPTYWRFRLYAGAIAYRKSQEVEKVIALLEEALRYPDCPSMVQNILANIYKRRGNFRRAAEIYRHILMTSRDGEAVSMARRELEELAGPRR